MTLPPTNQPLVEIPLGLQAWTHIGKDIHSADDLIIITAIALATLLSSFASWIGAGHKPARVFHWHWKIVFVRNELAPFLRLFITSISTMALMMRQQVRPSPKALAGRRITRTKLVVRADKKSVGDLKGDDLKGKKVFVRADLNVPLDKELKITDDTRIRAAVPTLKYLLDNGAIVLLTSHLVSG